MESFESKETCPRCRAAKLKGWEALTDDERFLAERLPASSEYTKDERRRHLFCPKCWHEQPPGPILT